MLAQTEDQAQSLEERLHEVEDRLERKSMQLDDVATMGLVITSLLNLEEVLSAMMEMATRMVEAEVGSIMLLEGDELQTRISWGLDDQVARSIKLENGDDIASAALKRGETVVLNGCAQTNSFGGFINTALAVPLASRERQIGVLLVINKASGGRFEAEDRVTLEMLVRFAAVAIENSELMQHELERQKLEQEMALAHQVQQALLPARSEDFARASIETTYRPAGQVGGDYFDIIRLTEDQFVVIVGDVSNKGVPAALMMTAVRSVFRMEVEQELNIDLLISNLNRFLCEQVLKPEAMFVSLTYAHFNLAAGECTFVNAGHLPPVHLRKRTGDLELWKTGGIVLGQFPDFTFKAETVRLEPGDRILFYTDGINERENSKGELYGRERLHRFVKAHADQPAAKFLESLLQEVDRFANGDDGMIDDITALTVEIK